MFTYRADVLQHLLRHGVRPTAHTPPELVRDFVRDLYKYEIRVLRDRYVGAVRTTRGPRRRDHDSARG